MKCDGGLPTAMYSRLVIINRTACIFGILSDQPTLPLWQQRSSFVECRARSAKGPSRRRVVIIAPSFILMCQRLWQRTVGRDDGKEAIIFEDFLKQEYICCLYHVRKKKKFTLQRVQPHSLELLYQLTTLCTFPLSSSQRGKLHYSSSGSNIMQDSTHSL